MFIDNETIDRFINLEDLSPQDLLMPVNFESVKYRAYNFIDSHDTSGALSFAVKLSELIEGLDAQNHDEAYVRHIMDFWVLRLKLFAFNRLKGQEKARFIKENALKILMLGMDLKTPLISYASQFYSQPVVESTFREFTQALVTNGQFLGSLNTMQQAGFSFKPTLGNWLREYQAIVKPGEADKTGLGAFHVVKFLDTNQYVKCLNTEEKKLLRLVLDLYNDLSHPNPFAKFSEPIEFDESANAAPYVNQQKITVPGGVMQKIQIFEQKQPPAVPAPTNKPVLQKVGMGEVVLKQDISVAEVKPAPVVPSPANVSSVLPNYKKPITGAPLTAANLAAKMAQGKDQGLRVQNQEVGNKLSADPIAAPSLPQMHSASPPKGEKGTEIAIDKKLHDLEDRVKNNPS